MFFIALYEEIIINYNKLDISYVSNLYYNKGKIHVYIIDVIMF